MNVVIVWLGPEVLLSLLPKTTLDYTPGCRKYHLLGLQSLVATAFSFKPTRSLCLQKSRLDGSPTRVELSITLQGRRIRFGVLQRLGFLGNQQVDQHAIE